MMSAAQTKAEALERNRRESFRINDRIALCVRPLSEAAYNQARTHFAASRHKQRTLNSILAVGDSQRGLLRNIRDTDPAVASYLKSLEERLDASAETDCASDIPKHCRRGHMSPWTCDCFRAAPA
jgi:hypothetical protein